MYSAPATSALTTSAHPRRSREPISATARKSVLIAVSTPLSYAVVSPIVRELARDPRIRLALTARHGGAAEAREFLGQPVPYHHGLIAKALPFDACICPGFHFQSRRVRRRIQIFHGVSMKNYAVSEKLDQFEHLFLIGEYHRRKMVQRRLLDRAAGRALQIGMPKTDPLVNDSRNVALLEELGLDPALPTVLYAPTRSGCAGSSLEHGGLETLEALADLPVNVLVKLHDRSQARYRKKLPTDYVSVLDHMQRRCPRFRRYSRHDIIPAMLAADVLLSDVSSAANEFLLRDKPVLYLPTPRHDALIRAHHEAFFPSDRFGLDYLRGAGEVVFPTDLAKAVDHALEHPERKSAERRERAALLFYNPGRATQAAVDALYPILGIADDSTGRSMTNMEGEAAVTHAVRSSSRDTQNRLDARETRAAEPNRLRIVHILSHDRVRSGGAIQALLLAREQRARGHDVRIIYNAGKHPSTARAEFQPLVDEGLMCAPVSMQGARRIVGRIRLRGVLDSWRPDIVHTHRERALLFAIDALQGRDKPALVAQKGNCNSSKPQAAEAFRSRRLSRIIAVANAVKDTLVRHDGVQSEKIEVVYGSFDASRFCGPADPEPVRAELGIDSGTPVVGILANLDRKKAHEDFILAASKVLAQRPDARFLVVGGGDDAALRASAADLGVLDKTTFLGFRKDVAQCLAAFDVSVNCSRTGEGLTGALRESLALARPVVCTDVGGNREIIEDGVTGHIVAAGDTDGLADAIVRMIDNPARAGRVAREGRDRVLRMMNTPDRAHRVIEIYRDVLGCRVSTAEVGFS